MVSVEEPPIAEPVCKAQITLPAIPVTCRPGSDMLYLGCWEGSRSNAVPSVGGPSATHSTGSPARLSPPVQSQDSSANSNPGSLTPSPPAPLTQEVVGILTCSNLPQWDPFLSLTLKKSKILQSVHCPPPMVLPA